MSYKEDQYFNTAVGGFATLAVIFGVLGYLVPTLYEVIVHPVFTLNQICNYEGYEAAIDKGIASEYVLDPL